MNAGHDVIADHVATVWADDVLPMLHDYIRIPCVSQSFDPEWKAHGFQDQATEMIRAWCAARLNKAANQSAAVSEPRVLTAA